jgi:hypothetical protein
MIRCLFRITIKYEAKEDDFAKTVEIDLRDTQTIRYYEEALNDEVQDADVWSRLHHTA